MSEFKCAVTSLSRCQILMIFQFQLCCNVPFTTGMARCHSYLDINVNFLFFIHAKSLRLKQDDMPNQQFNKVEDYMKMQNEPTRCSKKKKTEEKEKKIIKYIFLIQKKPSDMRSSINFTSIERFNKRRSILYRLIIIIKWTQTPQSILSHFEAQTWPRLFLLDHAIRRYIVIL